MEVKKINGKTYVVGNEENLFDILKSKGLNPRPVADADTIQKLQGNDTDILKGIEDIGRGALANLEKYGASLSKALGKNDAYEYFNNARRNTEAGITNKWAGLAGEVALDPINLLPAGVFTKGSKLVNIAKSTAGGVGMGVATSYAKDYGNSDMTDEEKKLNMALSGGLAGGINAVLAGITKGKVKNAIPNEKPTPQSPNTPPNTPPNGGVATPSSINYNAIMGRDTPQGNSFNAPEQPSLPPEYIKEAIVRYNAGRPTENDYYILRILEDRAGVNLLPPRKEEVIQKITTTYKPEEVKAVEVTPEAVIVTRNTIRTPQEALNVIIRQKLPRDIIPAQEVKQPINTTPIQEVKQPINTTPIQEVEVEQPIDITPKEEVKQPIDIAPKEEIKQPIDTAPKEEIEQPIDITPKEEVKQPIDITPKEEIPKFTPIEVDDIKDSRGKVNLKKLKNNEMVYYGGTTFFKIDGKLYDVFDNPPDGFEDMPIYKKIMGYHLHKRSMDDTRGGFIDKDLVTNLASGGIGAGIGVATDANQDGERDWQDALIGAGAGVLAKRGLEGKAKAGLSIEDISRYTKEYLDAISGVKNSFEKIKEIFKRNFTNTLPKDYLEIRADTQTRITNIAYQAEDLQKALSYLSKEDNEALHNYIAGDTKAVSKEIATLGDMIKKDIDYLSKELVNHGILSKEAYDEWAGHYIRRQYEKHFFDGIKNANRKHTIEELFTRGKVTDIKTLDDLQKAVDDYTTANRLDDVDVMQYGDIATAIDELSKKGIFGRVSEGKMDYFVDGKKLQVRRDYTYDERSEMGEIRDASITVPETILRLNKMVEHAKLLRDTRGIEELVSDFEKEGFVKLSNSPKYGLLAGKWVRKDLANDIGRMNDEMYNTLFSMDNPLAQVWLGYLRIWKKSKTIWNAPTHLTNILSNFTLMYTSGMSAPSIARHFIEASSILRYGAKMQDLKIKAMSGVITPEELKILQQLQSDSRVKMYEEARNMGLFGKSPLQDINRGVIVGGRESLLKKVDTKLSHIYQMEDVINRIAMYSYLKKQGLSSKQAKEKVLDIMPDYSAPLPQGYRVLRDMGISPFISWVYYVYPKLLKQVTTKRGAWQTVKMMGALAGLEYLLTKGEFTPLDNIPYIDTNKPEDMKGRNIVVNKVGDRVDTLKVDKYIPQFALTDPRNFATGLLSGLSTSLATNILEAISPNKPITNQYTGRPVTYPTKSRGQQAYDIGKYLSQQYVPLPNQLYNFWNFVEAKVRDKEDRKKNDTWIPRSASQEALKLLGINASSYSKSGLKKEQSKK